MNSTSKTLRIIWSFQRVFLIFNLLLSALKWLKTPLPSDLLTRSSWPENIPVCSMLSGWLRRHPPEPESRKFVIDFRLHCDQVKGYAPELICGAINWGFSGPLQSGDPCSDIPSWCIPKLCPISWAIMNPLASPISWFILHDLLESHIPWTPARPRVPQGAFCFAQISYLKLKSECVIFTSSWAQLNGHLHENGRFRKIVNGPGSKCTVQRNQSVKVNDPRVNGLKVWRYLFDFRAIYLDRIVWPPMVHGPSTLTQDRSIKTVPD